MACAAATFPGVTAFDRPSFSLADHRGMIASIVIGLGTVTAAAVVAGAVVMIAAWIMAVCFAANPDLKARTPMALETVGLTRPFVRLAGTVEFTALVRDLTHSAAVAAVAQSVATVDGTAATSDAEPVSTASLPPAAADVTVASNSAPALVGATLPSAPIRVPPLPPDRRIRHVDNVPLPTPRPPDRPQIAAQFAMAGPPAGIALPMAADAAPSLLSPTSFSILQPRSSDRTSEQADDMPLPSARPLSRPQIQAAPEMAGAPARPALPQVAAVTPSSSGSTFFNFLHRHLMPQSMPKAAIALPGTDGHAAIYDIAAHTVYLPNGQRLEAHSGLGPRLDDPRYVEEKDRGPTPPNVYNLTWRGELFHGVRAIRLNPVGDSRMFGRDGILAHTYMLGPSGQSFGCVSFKDYSEFLRAFESGEIDRLVVVPHLGTVPPGEQRASGGDAGHYAFNNR
jgi:hypothetical protein